MTEIVTPYILAAILVLCLLAAERKKARVRVAAVGLWCSSVAVASLVMYATDWPGSSGTWLNVLWSGLIAASIVWAVLVLRQPAPPAATATLPPPGTYAQNFVPPEPEPDPDPAQDRHWVRPGAARRRYEARRRRIPVIVSQRRKRQNV